MKSLMVGMLAAMVACSPDRNMDRTPGKSRVGGETSSAAGADAGGPVPDTTRAGSAKVTVLFFGTSLTAGYGLDPAIAFPNLIARLAAGAGVPILAVNAGLSGETSAGALRRIDWTLRKPVDVVVVETGGNDALRALDPDSLKTNLRGIVSRIRAAQPGARILLVVMEAPPNLGARYTSSFRKAYREVAAKQRLTLVPFLLDGVAGTAELNQADGVHPNEKGARIVADNVWRSLEPVVREVYSEVEPRR